MTCAQTPDHAHAHSLISGIFYSLMIAMADNEGPDQAVYIYADHLDLRSSYNAMFSFLMLLPIYFILHVHIGFSECVHVILRLALGTAAGVLSVLDGIPCPHSPYCCLNISTKSHTSPVLINQRDSVTASPRYLPSLLLLRYFSENQTAILSYRHLLARLLMKYLSESQATIVFGHMRTAKAQKFS